MSSLWIFIVTNYTSWCLFPISYHLFVVIIYPARFSHHYCSQVVLTFFFSQKSMAFRILKTTILCEIWLFVICVYIKHYLVTYFSYKRRYIVYLKREKVSLVFSRNRINVSENFSRFRLISKCRRDCHMWIHYSNYWHSSLIRSK